MSEMETVVLRWAEPMTVLPLDPEDPAEVAVADQMGAATQDAKAYNQVAQEWFEERGWYHGDEVEGTAEFTHRLKVVFHDRLFSQPRLTCPHDGEVTVWRCFNGPFVALCCPRPACQAALDRHIEETAHIQYCAVCDDRSAWRRVIEVGVAIDPGRLTSLVHVDCTPVTTQF